MEDKQIKKIVVIFVILAILSLGIVYAALSSKLDIEGSAKIDSTWDIKIINIKEINKSTTANTVNKDYSNTLASFSVNLTSPGDYVEYQVEVKNNGTLDAYLDTITRSVNNNEAIIFTTSGLKKGDIITSSDTKTINVKVEYAESITSQPQIVSDELSIELNFKQKK